METFLRSTPLRFAIVVGISSTFSIIVSVLELFIATPKQVKISSKSWMLFEDLRVIVQHEIIGIS